MSTRINLAARFLRFTLYSFKSTSNSETIFNGGASGGSTRSLNLHRRRRCSSISSFRGRHQSLCPNSIPLRPCFSRSETLLGRPSPPIANLKCPSLLLYITAEQFRFALQTTKLYQFPDSRSPAFLRTRGSPVKQWN